MAEKPRHEYKFSLSQKDYLAVRSRLRAVLSRDPHEGEKGGYTVSSVYFDDPFDRALGALSGGGGGGGKLLSKSLWGGLREPL